MSVLRGRPPGLAGGISGSKRRNWSSVRACPEPKSPTSARSAGVHMAVSRKKPPPTPLLGPRSARQTSPVDLLKRALSDDVGAEWVLGALEPGTDPGQGGAPARGDAGAPAPAAPDGQVSVNRFTARRRPFPSLFGVRAAE